MWSSKVSWKTDFWMKVENIYLSSYLSESIDYTCMFKRVKRFILIHECISTIKHLYHFIDRTILLFEHSDLVIIAGASALFTSNGGGPAKVGINDRWKMWSVQKSSCSLTLVNISPAQLKRPRHLIFVYRYFFLSSCLWSIYTDKRCHIFPGCSHNSAPVWPWWEVRSLRRPWTYPLLCTNNSNSVIYKLMTSHVFMNMKLIIFENHALFTCSLERKIFFNRSYS